jgi:CheY-like chemotaxis protein
LGGEAPARSRNEGGELNAKSHGCCVNILILEDEPSILALTRAILRPLGHTLFEASTAQEAYTRFHASGECMHLLIADVTLPASSGIRVALELQTACSSLQIVLTSGYPRQMWSPQSTADLGKLQPGSFVILAKPFLPAALREEVARVEGIVAQRAAARRAKS